MEWRYPLHQRMPDLHGREDEPIGRALRTAVRQSRAGVQLSLEMNAAFDDAFKQRVRERGQEFVDDPLGGLVALPSPVLLTPDGALLKALQDAAALWAYARELRSMPLRDAALARLPRRRPALGRRRGGCGRGPAAPRDPACRAPAPAASVAPAGAGSRSRARRRDDARHPGARPSARPRVATAEAAAGAWTRQRPKERDRWDMR